MAHPAASLAALWERGIVLNAQHVAHGIITISIVHDGACLGIDHEVLQSATCRVIRVERLRSVAVLEVSALLELVVVYLADIVVAVGLVAPHMVHLSAEVVAVGHFLLIGIDHFQQAVVAVVLPLRDVGGHCLVGHDQRAYGLQHLTHLAVVISNHKIFFLLKRELY